MRMYLHIYPFKSKSLVCDHKQARKYTHTHMRNPVMLVWGSLRLTPIISGPLSLDWKAGYSILENV